MILTAFVRGVKELAAERSSLEEESHIPHGSEAETVLTWMRECQPTANPNPHTVIIGLDRHRPLLLSAALEQRGHGGAEEEEEKGEPPFEKEE